MMLLVFLARRAVTLLGSDQTPDSEADHLPLETECAHSRISNL